MKRKFYFFFAVLIFILFTVSASAQQLNDYQSAGGGVPVDLSSATNWQYWNGSAWVTATQAPFALVGTNGTITIQSGDTWNNATALSLGSKNATIKFNGNTGTFSTTNKLTLNGNTYQHNVSGGEATIAAGITFSSGSTTIYSATSGSCNSFWKFNDSCRFNIFIGRCSFNSCRWNIDSKWNFKLRILCFFS